MTHFQKYWTLKSLEEEKSLTVDVDSVHHLKTWIETQPNLPDFISDEQIVLFLQSCSSNVEETKNCIKSYYKLRKEAPQFFSSRDIRLANLKKALSVLYYGILPEKTPDGCKIVFHMLKDTKPSNYLFDDGFKLLMMLIDGVNAREGPQEGIVMLFDMKGVKLGHVIKLPLYSVRKSLEYIQDAIPVRLKSIHVLNVHSIIDKIMLLVKPFLRKQFLELLHFYKENDENIYKAIPKKCLPKNYGGLLETVEFYHQKFIEEMKILRPLFIEENAAFGRNKKTREKMDAEVNLSNLTID